MNHGESPLPRRGIVLHPYPRRRIDWESRALAEGEVEQEIPASARRIVVARGPRWGTVDLRRLYTSVHEGKLIVSLLDIWVASGIKGDLFEHAFDFYDARGRPASRRGEPRLDSDLFAAGWLTIATHDVVWPGPEAPADHWRVHGITAIVAVKAGAVRRKRPTRTYGAPPAHVCRTCGR